MTLPYLHQIDPVILQLGPVALRWYGLSYLFAAGFAYFLATRRVQQAWRGFSRADAEDVCYIGLLSGVLGGRVGYVVFYSFNEFLAAPLSALKVWDGGMSFHGGLLGVIVGLSIWAWRRGRKPFAVLDFVAPLIPVGLGAVRLFGNFFGGELWGRRTDSSVGMLFPHQPELAGYSHEQLLLAYQSGALNQFTRHPSQLYQAVLEGVVLAAVMWLYTRSQRPYRAAGGLFVAGYGVQRFIVEFFREPDAQLGFVALKWMTMGQLLCIPMIVFGLGLMWVAYRAKPTLGEADTTRLPL
jgi:phosphatidylglycerol---prolipoprotein diacylglyceryl transferase